MCVSGYIEFQNRDGVGKYFILLKDSHMGVTRKTISLIREIPHTTLKNFRIGGERLGTVG